MPTAIGFSLQNQYSLPIKEVIFLLHQAGFSAISPVWSSEAALSEIVAATRAQGMTLQSLHAPARGIANLWNPDEAISSEIKNAVLCSIDACAQFQIPILVLHGWSGFDYTFREDTLYFDNFEQIVHHAKCKGIYIAFENLQGEEFLVALMKHFRDHDNVGYCWDSGHAHCYPHKTDFLAEFGDRLIMTHLNDNLGTRDPNGIPSGVDDLHFLPFDGTIDWTEKLQQLRTSRKLETLNFELKVTSHSKAPEDRIYENIPLPAYLAEAANRAKRIAEAYSKL